MTIIKIGSRKSKLAMWQTDTVAGMLEASGLTTEISSMETKGDKILDVSIAKIGSKGVFTEELEDQLANGTTDIAVHSAKDMQSILPQGFELIAFTEREKVNDVLVGLNADINLDDPKRPLIIGTSSVRRKALLKHHYPHVQTVEMRGNLQTRIQKMRDGACDALMLAYAGVKRMEYDHMIIKIFDEKQFIPPVGQGCIAIEAAGNLATDKVQQVRNCLNNPDSESCLLAERAYLRKLEGGCSIPAFGLAMLDGDQLHLTGGLASLDGSNILSKTESGPREEAELIGKRLGDYILENGGREMLAEIRREQG
ncbi:MAG: hydroxymethylbilane synthase [Desulfobulbaceae bacterium]|uniref:Hydroxymethylbilane synthase n=1 Tax=Candidatus Desulfatifera sulfidica TaxID=2841691 RepID=A0A8J6N8W4_9BACT|nr:hydroxymethylbilane synthase [Candidatus Desulfatifera sulfidica]